MGFLNKIFGKRGTLQLWGEHNSELENVSKVLGTHEPLLPVKGMGSHATWARASVPYDCSISLKSTLYEGSMTYSDLRELVSKLNAIYGKTELFYCIDLFSYVTDNLQILRHLVVYPSTSLYWSP